MKAKISGTWKDVDPKVKVGGVWKDATESWVKVGGVWKNSYYRYPIVSGGTLTSDATYYYRTFTDSTQIQNFTIERAPLQFDYLVVGGGGAGGSDTSTVAVGADTCYNQCFTICFDYWGNLNPCSYNCNPYSCNTRNWYKHNAGGGAGGVITGSIKYNPGVYEIKVGAGGTSNSNGVPSSIAKTLIAWGGGGATGAASGTEFDSYLNANRLLGSGNGSNNVRSKFGRSGTSPQGTSGGGTIAGTTAEWNTIISGSEYNNSSAQGVPITTHGWGGGAGKQGSGVGEGSNLYSPNSASVMRTTTDPSQAMYKPVSEPGLTATYVEKITSTIGTAGIWNNVTWGTGVEVFGIKVAGGGMNNANARTLTNSYGGGYPVSGTGSVSGLTYSVHGTPNTGGGGGYQGNGGSGIICIRYLRSAVGG